MDIVGEVDGYSYTNKFIRLINELNNLLRDISNIYFDMYKFSNKTNSFDILIFMKTACSNIKKVTDEHDMAKIFLNKSFKQILEMNIKTLYDENKNTWVLSKKVKKREILIENRDKISAIIIQLDNIFATLCRLQEANGTIIDL